MAERNWEEEFNAVAPKASPGKARDWEKEFDAVSPAPPESSAGGPSPSKFYLRKLEEGTAGVLGSVSDISKFAASHGVPNLLDLAQGGSNTLGSKSLLDFADKLGIVPAEQAPESTAQRYAGKAVEGIPMGVLLAMTGGGALPALLAGPGGEVGGELGGDLTGGSALGKFAGSLLPGLLGMGGAVRGAANAESKNVLGELSSAEEAAQAAKQAKTLGVRNNQDIVSEAKTQSKQALGLHMQSINQAFDDVNNAAQGTVKNIASGLGKSQTLQEAGGHLQESARTWLNELPNKQSMAWNPVNSLVSGDTPVSLSNFRDALKHITTDAGGLEPVAGLLKPVLPQRLRGALEKVEDLGGLTGQSTTWEEVRKLRTVLGEARGNGKIAPDIGHENLSRLYAAVSDDLRNSIKSNPQALSSFDQANAESTRLFNLAEGPIGKIISTPNARQELLKPEDVANSFLSSGKKGASDLQALRGESEFTPALGELASAHLNSNPKAWQKLAPEAKTALVPDQLQRDLIETQFQQMEKAKEVKSAAQQFAKQADQSRQGLVGKQALQSNRDIADALTAADQRLQTAKGRAAGLSDEARAVAGENSVMKRLGGELTGKSLDTIARLLGLPSPQGLFEALGTLEPYVRSGIRGVGRNPSLVKYPLAAEAGNK